VLLAALAANGTTRVHEPLPSRDHTERLLRRAGAAVRRTGFTISVDNADELSLESIDIPGDISSAAFPIAAGVLVRGSRLLIEGVGVNRTRTGFIEILRRMGAIVEGDLEPPAGADDDASAEEPVAELDIAYGPLIATEVAPEEVPLAIDELPLVALVGCFAEGDTIVRGAAELRLKEIDRIAGVVSGLRGLGAEIEEAEDGFVVHGDPPGCAAA